MVYIATALTGFTALCGQVIWQRHLAILTGSEARSLSLTIAIFLAGLSAGYFIFGLLTERKNQSRKKLMKYYGYVETLTGAYMGVFPFYFHFLKQLSFHSPNLLIIDIAVTLLALLLPTVLMGASIPLLTAVLPENAKEVNKLHAKIYGWNAFGACWGALVSGFILIPFFGLNFSLSIIGIINVLAAFVFIGNKLTGSVQKREEPSSIPSPLSNSFLMAFVFLTGSLVISLEIIFIRILNVSLGAGLYNFPVILSIFVGGLAVGSLSLNKQKITIGFLIRQLLITLFILELLFVTAPYWSIWFNNIRVLLAPIPPSYFMYYALIFVFLMLFVFPAVFFMGRLLPLSYMLLKKTKKNYGKFCGFLYFFNTLGTMFGAIFVGFLAFYIFNLDILFKANIYILFLLTLIALLFAIHKINKSYFIILSFLGLILLLLPSKWDRTGHEIGYFRTKKYSPEIHFRNPFFLPKITNRKTVGFFKDGPNSTVSLFLYENPNVKNGLQGIKKLFPKMEHISSYTISVNGKSDGNSLGDFSTMFFMLPYLYLPKKDLSAVFIGLGTGLSAGTYVPLEDVKSVKVLEISPFVIKAIESSPPELNFNFMKNEKIKIIETDAFKYFTRQKGKFDIIISEPSNPWVTGVENLFTVEFYELVTQSLNKGGIFGQWIHTYDMDIKTLDIVIKTVSQVFPYAHLYQIGYGDLLIVASLEKLNPLSKEKFNHPFVKKFYKAMGFRTVEDLYLSKIFNETTIHKQALLSSVPINSLIFPRIIYNTNKALFLGTKAEPHFLINKLHFDNKRKTQKMKVFEKYKNTTKSVEWNEHCLKLSGFNFFCTLMHNYILNWEHLNNEKESILTRFNNYIFLRRNGLIPYNDKIMAQFFQESLKLKNRNLNSLSDYISEKVQIGKYESANKDATTFKNNGLIAVKHYSNFKADLNRASKAHTFLKKLLKTKDSQ